MASFDFSGEPRSLRSLMGPKITATLLTSLIVSTLRAQVSRSGQVLEIRGKLVPCVAP